MKKSWILPVIPALCLGLFTACASNADTMPSPSPTVISSPSVSPMATSTGTPAATTAPTMASGVNTIEDAMRVSDEVTQEVGKLSELDNADAVVANNIALVGIRYDAQYQGGLTDRLIDMAEARVLAIDKTITTVHVTDDEKLADSIKELHDQLNGEQLTFEQLQTQMLSISSQMTGGAGATDAPGGTAAGTDAPQATSGV